MNLPLVPDSCHISGRAKANIDGIFEGIARVASTFKKVNKNSNYRESFLNTFGLSGKFISPVQGVAAKN